MNFFETFLKKHPLQEMRIDNVTGEYLVGGKGKIGFLVFPGSGQEAISCFDLIDNFENEYKTIAVSFKGFYDLETFFRFIDLVLKKENIEKIVLYGLSLGGFLAQHYTRGHKEKVIKLILSHSGSTKSKTVIERVIRPGRIAYFFLPIIPFNLFRFLAKKFAGPIQSRASNLSELRRKYMSIKDLDLRREFYNRFGLNFLSRDYLKSVYLMGIDMIQRERDWKSSGLENWSKNILIIRTENDPIAQDDGVFRMYYPMAKVHTFHETGHLTPFIQFKTMSRVMRSFLKEDAH